MTKEDKTLRHQILDLLVDGPSSFAALYGALVQHYGHEADLSVDTCIDALVAMEDAGWMVIYRMADDGSFSRPDKLARSQARHAYRMWLPGSAFDDLSVDEVGLWLKLQPSGREEWESWAASFER